MLYDISKIKEFYTDGELKELEKSFCDTNSACIFLNKIKCEAKELEQSLQKEEIIFTRIDDFTYKIQDKHKASQSEAFSKGLFYIQNYSSYLCAKNLDVSKDDIVLDMCAAPGGKSINLANFMQNQGDLRCVELNKNRFFKLKTNLQKYGVKNAKLFCKNALNIGKLCPLSFDKILLDAPCSAFSKLGFKFQRTNNEIKSLAKLQKKLLNSAINALKIGGILVYSTCTVTREENEEVILNALNSKFKLELLELNTNPLKSAKNPHIKNTARIIANEFSQSFFMCKIMKLA
ncbi:tRNA/rRNA cytosine-C5-methylase, NOL1/NOP2/Sun family [Campylobacter avium LMG 24591]|uniref:tRNA/rRNA cytosine-C5-methylase, NOL1/NOP2/Sun family n=1 Tax=Campylobacter avium LMG 24591 TaxID=522484 RepID=A0A222MWX0_9BACT|nr:RsmB/NOP family class I SAM-dependent RNA methyltransferase [Campylobacter avium]ASQ30271.1 tRNA/rRNA cytosine-C5-methylase, NOL1/NOP2/Sun family [Campylobacter avium LMG 24591]